MAFDLDGVNRALGATVGTLGSQIQSKMGALQGAEMSELDMIDLQHSLNKWSMMVNMQTNILKTMSDGMKSIVTNMR